MHRIKRPLLRTWILAFAAIGVTAQAIAQPRPLPAEKGSKTSEVAKGPGLATPTSIRTESRELTDARFELEHLLQDFADAHPKVVAQRARISMLEKLEPQKISIDFPGGPISKLVEMIARHEGVSLTVIELGEDSRGVGATLQPFSVRNANLRTIMEVVQNILGPRGFVLAPVGIEPNSIICTLQRAGDARPETDDFSALQLSHLIHEKQSVDDIVEAIRFAWKQTANQPAELRLKFHPPTKLLLVYGPKPAILVAEKIVAALRPLPPAASLP